MDRDRPGHDRTSPPPIGVDIEGEHIRGVDPSTGVMQPSGDDGHGSDDEDRLTPMAVDDVIQPRRVDRVIRRDGILGGDLFTLDS